MAPITAQSVLAQKRPLSTSANDLRPSKRVRQSYHRHHSLQYKAQIIPTAEPVIIEQHALDKLLVDSIKSVCEEQAAKRGVQYPVIESLALEAFRNATEEFILRFCAIARRSMLAARRTAPIPTDFEYAMSCLDLTRPNDQLEPFRTKPPINPPLLPTPPPEDEFHREFQLPRSILGPELDGEAEKQKEKYIPSHLPPFPSRHTYKDTPVFPTREVDPRKIRELATEEGKLGEEALRKLAGAVKAEKTISTTPQSRQGGTSKGQKGPGSREETTERMFEATMRDLLKGAPEGAETRFELGPIVNWEKRFLMQDSAPTTQRRPPDQPRPLLAVDTHGLIATGSDKVQGKHRARGVEREDLL